MQSMDGAAAIRRLLSRRARRLAVAELVLHDALQAIQRDRVALRRRRRP
jgi:hypothetical protein